MKKIKQINWNKIIETIKTIIIVALIALPIGIWIGVNYQKAENNKIVETVRNLSQNK